jgi:hypothetical protein
MAWCSVKALGQVYLFTFYKDKMTSRQACRQTNWNHERRRLSDILVFSLLCSIPTRWVTFLKLRHLCDCSAFLKTSIGTSTHLDAPSTTSPHFQLPLSLHPGWCNAQCRITGGHSFYTVGKERRKETHGNFYERERSVHAPASFTPGTLLPLLVGEETFSCRKK